MAYSLACSSISPSSALSSRVSLSSAGVPGFRPVRVCIGRREATAPAATRVAPIRAQAQDNDGATPAAAGLKKKGKPVVAKQRVLLRFLWLEKNIGIALDQEIPGHGCVPLSPYFFWPRKDAWEELRAKLESKSWISRKRTIILLNQATDIINLWQQSSSASQ